MSPLAPEAWYERGLALYKLDSYEDALQSFDAALKLDENYVDAWNNKGVTLDKLGRYEEAIDCYEQFLRSNPGTPEPGKTRASAEKARPVPNGFYLL